VKSQLKAGFSSPIRALWAYAIRMANSWGCGELQSNRGIAWFISVVASPAGCLLAKLVIFWIVALLSASAEAWARHDFLILHSLVFNCHDGRRRMLIFTRC
jgi:hypothetical protein